MRGACFAIGLVWVVSAAAEALYRLPWPDGLAFMFIQAPGGRITSHFTKATLHAVDIGMPEGVPVLAARDGVVDALEAEHGAAAEEEPLTYEGNFVRVRHDDGTVALYAHLQYRRIAVAVGEVVAAGRVLGHSGSTGDAAQPQLHFGVLRTVVNSAGWAEEVSVPVKFYVGNPPLAFAPRAAVTAKAAYSGPAELPRAPSDGVPLFPWKRPALGPGEELPAWGLLALWLACGGAGLAWFWRFSRKR